VLVADERIVKFESEGDDASTIKKKKWLFGFNRLSLQK
jgi:hypothetical protein